MQLGSSVTGNSLQFDLPRLVLGARRQDVNEVVLECLALGKKAGCEAVAVLSDVTHESDCKYEVLGPVGPNPSHFSLTLRRLVDVAVRQFGGLDALVLNAGISMNLTFEEMTDLSILKQLMETNYWGCVHLMLYALPHLKQKKDTRVLVMSSMAGPTPPSPPPTPLPHCLGLVGALNRTGYAASKFALHGPLLLPLLPSAQPSGFFESLRLELLPYGVTITLSCPSWVRTDLDRTRLGRKEETSLANVGGGMDAPVQPSSSFSSLLRRRRPHSRLRPPRVVIVSSSPSLRCASSLCSSSSPLVCLSSSP